MTTQTTTNMQADNLLCFARQCLATLGGNNQHASGQTGGASLRSAATQAQAQAQHQSNSYLGSKQKQPHPLLHIAGPISVLITQKSMFSILHGARRRPGTGMPGSPIDKAAAYLLLALQVLATHAYARVKQHNVLNVPYNLIMAKLIG